MEEHCFTIHSTTIGEETERTTTLAILLHFIPGPILWFYFLSVPRQFLWYLSLFRHILVIFLHYRFPGSRPERHNALHNQSMILGWYYVHVSMLQYTRRHYTRTLGPIFPCVLWVLDVTYVSRPIDAFEIYILSNRAYFQGRSPKVWRVWWSCETR